MAGSLTTPTRSVAVGRDNEDHNIDILVQSVEEAVLTEEQATIDDGEGDS